jgi:ferredoxin-2, mitochondrial
MMRMLWTARRVSVSLQLSGAVRHCVTSVSSPAAAVPGKVKVVFITQDGTRVPVSVPIGITLMEAARDVAKLDVEAACDGTCACSTCHMYLSEGHFKKLPDPSEDELDMLDLAPTPRPTSRLSCQVTVTQDLDGLEATLPTETSNQLS